MSKRDSPYPQEAQTLKKNIIYTKCEYCEIIWMGADIWIET